MNKKSYFKLLYCSSFLKIYGNHKIPIRLNTCIFINDIDTNSVGLHVALHTLNIQ